MRIFSNIYIYIYRCRIIDKDIYVFGGMHLEDRANGARLKEELKSMTLEGKIR